MTTSSHVGILYIVKNDRTVETLKTEEQTRKSPKKESSMKKLTEQLNELSNRVKMAEAKVAAATQESKEKVEASIQKSKAEAEARRESFKASVMEDQAVTAAQWKELQDHHNQKMQQIKNKIETEKEAREVKKANKRAEEAAANAQAAIEFAEIAFDEAEIAVLEVIAARADMIPYA